MSGGRSLLLTYLGVLLVLAAAGYSALVLVPDVAYGQAPETWYMRDTSVDVLSCGSDLNRDASQTAGSSQSTHTLTTDVYDYWYGRTGPGEFEAGNWVVDFWITTAGDGGAPNRVTVVVERVSSACVVQQTIVDDEVQMSAGTTQEYSTTPVNPGIVTLASGERIVIRYARTNGNRQSDLLYDNAEGGQADTQIWHPVDPVNSGCPDSTDSFGVYESSGCTINGATTWGNGTLYMVGATPDITVNAPLTLWNMDIYFNQSVDRTADFFVWTDLTMGSSSTIRTNPTNPAVRWDITTSGGNGVIDIQDSTFSNGIYTFSNAETATIKNNVFQDSDMTDNTQHMWIGPNSTLEGNTFQNITVSESAVVVIYQNWGESTIFGNEFNIDCDGNNCMGIEVINLHDDFMDLYPGYPTVEISWNNITWNDITTGSNAHTYDNEFSKRLYIHNNTGTVDPGSTDGATEGLQAGGLLESTLENNTFEGPFDYGIYQYIYENAEVTYQYNIFNDTLYAAIIQTGNNTYAHNTFTNITYGIWICPDSSCAGSSANPADNEYYNNSQTYKSTGYIARVQTGGAAASALQNILIAYGSPENGITTYRDWVASDVYHTAWGDGAWLYWANATIEGLAFTNSSSGSRYVNMTVWGTNYHSVNSSFGATDDASLSVEGNIDQEGSMNRGDDKEGTFLWQLGRDNTGFDLLSDGGTTYINITSFTTNQDYNITIWNYSSSAYENDTFTTDGSGDASFSKSMAANKYNITITPYDEAGWSNTAPTIQDKIAEDTATDGVPYSRQLNATDPDTNQTLVWTLNSDASFMSIDGQNRTAWVNGTPDATGSYYVNVTVGDEATTGNETDYENSTLTVSSSWSNTAPSITDPLTTDEAGHNISYSEGFTATDPDTNQTLLWTLVTNGSFLSVVSSNRTATVSGTPAFTDRDSTYYVNLTVADQGCGGACNLSDFSNYTLYVNNSLPYVTNGLVSDTGLVDILYARDFDHQDNNTDTPAWSLASDAAFLSVEVTTGWVNGTPDGAGTFYANVSVVDYSASGGYANYTLTVGTRGGGVGSGRLHITLFSTAIKRWDTVVLRASAELEESGEDPSNATLSYRWDFGDGSMIQEGPEVTHTYSMGLWARYIVTLQVCTPGDTVCETRSASILLIHWPIVGVLAAGSIVATAILGHRRIRHRVLEVSR